MIDNRIIRGKPVPDRMSDDRPEQSSPPEITQDDDTKKTPSGVHAIIGTEDRPSADSDDPNSDSEAGEDEPANSIEWIPWKLIETPSGESILTKVIADGGITVYAYRNSQVEVLLRVANLGDGTAEPGRIMIKYYGYGKGIIACTLAPQTVSLEIWRQLLADNDERKGPVEIVNYGNRPVIGMGVESGEVYYVITMEPNLRHALMVDMEAWIPAACLRGPLRAAIECVASLGLKFADFQP